MLKYENVHEETQAKRQRYYEMQSRQQGKKHIILCGLILRVTLYLYMAGEGVLGISRFIFEWRAEESAVCVR